MQFRLIENKFGLLERDRLQIEGHNYVATLRDDHAELVVDSESVASLFDNIERWLARLPFVRTGGYDFIAQYEEAANEMHAAARAKIEGLPGLDAVARQRQLTSFESSTKRFGAVFDRASWEHDVRDGSRRFSYEAFMAALFIYLYREEPVLQVPFRILEMLIDIDETLTLWRQRHALDGPPDARPAGRHGGQRLRLPGRDSQAVHAVQGSLRRVHLPHPTGLPAVVAGFALRSFRRPSLVVRAGVADAARR